ncbi:ubiquitin carboxyl-terminal hydrolase 27 [Punica granatum]|uniref:ubiquitinyl hydrolase 1 n=2 Tax=Punica granatum TaxID=22663 RepID=A0A6P8D0F5_PUNGR|nr:ubiquitin carboxyl-terminal hydrolase 27 [Punica granatum]XP_031387909.1 ubiquitin carboxyl-terminal hydrolase 27 [Punica granatum]XP_031387910.1 ubiquitin carboxyl-terminal hydrolase 27 [Punica granatum]
MSLKSGHYLKSHMAWASAPVVQTSVAGLVGVAGLIFAIKRDGILGTLGCLSWFPGRRTISEEDYTVPGLHNRSNNCFLNVILQALAACSYFQPFLEEITEEYQKLSTQDRSGNLPLIEALETLLEGLRVLSEKKIVLDPSQVMKEISHHVPSFRLTEQQDANEALGLLISSLREELLGCYIPYQSPLAIPTASSGRILSPLVGNDQSEQERWQKHILGPFDGITGSILTCQNCLSQLELVFEFFYTIIVVPVPTHGSAIMRGCTLFDCLRQFCVAHRESTCCKRCWHTAAAAYLSSLTEKNEGEIEKVEACTWGDSCECRSLSGLGSFPWTDDWCRIIRRTRIARPPAILCIQLARATAYERGDAFKLQGHVSFPLVLDISPFVLSGFGVNMQGNLNMGPWLLQQSKQRLLNLRSTPFNPQTDRRMPSGISKSSRQEESHCSVQDELPDLGQAEGCSTVTKTDSCSESTDKKIQTAKKVFGDSRLYRLVSVVEHFGGMDDGHYTIYRSVRSNTPGDGHCQDSDEVPVRWFSISDTEVVPASEEEVLASNACMLFYERVPAEEISFDA